MASWIVFSRARSAGPAADAARTAHGADLGAAGDADFVFVRDSFSWLTLFFAPVMLAIHRLWLALAIYVVLALLLSAIAVLADVPEDVPGLILLGLNVLYAFELGMLRARKLRRQGYQEEAIVTASRPEEAEHRFFDRWCGHPVAPNMVSRAPASGQAPADPSPAHPVSAIPPLVRHAVSGGIPGLAPRAPQSGAQATPQIIGGLS